MPPVFRCVASRNKRKPRLIGNFEPGLGLEVLQRFCGSKSRAGREPPPSGRPVTHYARLGTRRLRPVPTASNSQPNSPPHSPCRPSPPSGKAAGRRGRRFCEPQKLCSILCHFGLRAPRVGQRPSAQARRPCGSQEFSPILHPFVLGASPRASAFGHPEIAASTPKPRTAILRIALLALGPKHRPASAPLRLRYRSATCRIFPAR